MSTSCTPKELAVNETAKRIIDIKWWNSYVSTNMGGDVHAWIISYENMYKLELNKLNKQIDTQWIREQENIHQLLIPIPLKKLIQSYSKTISFVGNP